MAKIYNGEEHLGMLGTEFIPVHVLRNNHPVSDLVDNFMRFIRELC